MDEALLAAGIIGDPAPLGFLESRGEFAGDFVVRKRSQTAVQLKSLLSSVVIIRQGVESVQERQDDVDDDVPGSRRTYRGWFAVVGRHGQRFRQGLGISGFSECLNTGNQTCFAESGNQSGGAKNPSPRMVRWPDPE